MEWHTPKPPPYLYLISRYPGEEINVLLILQPSSLGLERTVTEMSAGWSSEWILPHHLSPMWIHTSEGRKEGAKHFGLSLLCHGPLDFSKNIDMSREIFVQWYLRVLGVWASLSNHVLLCFTNSCATVLDLEAVALNFQNNCGAFATHFQLFRCAKWLWENRRLIVQALRVNRTKTRTKKSWRPSAEHTCHLLNPFFERL